MTKDLYLSVDDANGARGIYSSWAAARDALVAWSLRPEIYNQTSPQYQDELFDLLSWLQSCPDYDTFNDDKRTTDLYEFNMVTVWRVPLDKELSE